VTRPVNGRIEARLGQGAEQYNGARELAYARATMRYHVTCACGREIRVTAASAGGEVACRCGAAVAVPRLSDLRKSSGKGAYVTSTVDVIAAMLRAERLPWGNTCAHSEFPTEDVSARPWHEAPLAREWVGRAS
jgi:hypothetical protein